MDIMAEITRKGGLFSTKVVGTERVDGLECAIDGRKGAFGGCRYDVLLDTPGKSDEPRIVASGSFPQAIWALKRSDDALGCIGLLKAVALELGDPDSDLTRGLGGDTLSILAALRIRAMGAGEVSDILRIPESTAAIALLELKGEGMVWQYPRRECGGERAYHLSAIGSSICDVLAEDGAFAAIAEAVAERAK